MATVMVKWLKECTHGISRPNLFVLRESNDWLLCCRFTHLTRKWEWNCRQWEVVCRQAPSSRCSGPVIASRSPLRYQEFDRLSFENVA